MQNEDILNNLIVPEINTPKHQERLRNALLNQDLSQKRKNKINFLNLHLNGKLIFYSVIILILLISGAIYLIFGQSDSLKTQITKKLNVVETPKVAFIDKVIASEKEKSKTGDYLKIKMEFKIFQQDNEYITTTIEQTRNESNNYLKTSTLDYYISNPKGTNPLVPDNLGSEDLSSLYIGLGDEEKKNLDELIKMFKESDPNSCGTGDGERTIVECYGKYYIQLIPSITFDETMFDNLNRLDEYMAGFGYKRLSLYEVIKLRYFGSDKADNALYNVFSSTGLDTAEIFESIKKSGLKENEGEFDGQKTIYFENELSLSRKRQVHFSKDDYSLVGIREYTKVKGIGTLEFQFKILEYEYISENEATSNEPDNNPVKSIEDPTIEGNVETEAKALLLKEAQETYLKVCAFEINLKKEICSSDFFTDQGFVLGEKGLREITRFKIILPRGKYEVYGILKENGLKAISNEYIVCRHNRTCSSNNYDSHEPIVYDLNEVTNIYNATIGEVVAGINDKLSSTIEGPLIYNNEKLGIDGFKKIYKKVCAVNVSTQKEYCTSDYINELGIIYKIKVPDGSFRVYVTYEKDGVTKNIYYTNRHVCFLTNDPDKTWCNNDDIVVVNVKNGAIQTDVGVGLLPATI